MPQRDIREVVRELEAQRDHADVISFCSHALDGEPSREDRIFLCRKQAQHLAMLNPEAWGVHLVSALKVALDEVDDDPAAQAQLLTALSAAQAPLGLPNQVQATLTRWQKVAAQHPTPDVTRYEGDIWYNLGRCYESARDLANTEVSYQHALDCYRALGITLKLGMTLHNMAHVFVRTGRTAAARSALTEAQPLIPDEIGGAKVACLDGKISFAEGHLETARSLYERALAHHALDEYTRVDVLIAWAELDRAAGNFDQATTRAKEALILAYRLPYREVRRELEQLLSALNGGGDK